MRNLVLTGLLLATSAMAQGAPLTKAQVVDYIETRIATNRLQMDMKANADQYDSVIQSFYEKRKALLNDRGWTVSNFDSVQGRVLRARNAMDLAVDLEKLEAQNDETLESMRAAGQIPKDKLAEMEKAMDAMEQAQRDQVDATRPDWPAVKPYVDELEQLTDWVAGNTPEPPTL